ncbi:ABC transporter ATP-binding protein [Clostridium cagae]|uniref:Oligopeptide transport ATP-binding protein AppF n=1 Tax=Clostridium botulinum (strain Eklund 17B / Type B) TaxID=935198 RepID=B2TS71_CLOBB|nr:MULTISPECIES: dipeptide ABC transporter ATP-binding protein [Clostridium]ACD22825.1 oligopeptide transport ATP-binding protein AppF [Clostridium botulinum B str. Eklund 17B (NRP)]MBN1045981.1 dipeptide ABC transporter ATP-binding protein [Clostridium botulinum]MBN1052741.1 dipeptide ABC transporter ATP-binding protein [Clostridium botulinum]MBN1055908.1 dipeptide ABC transporter ATP-binding protein [Clostridium botulinum]MBY6976009.1 dipeptide ABC transporter ATP-binding protein [Clostridiu
MEKDKDVILEVKDLCKYFPASKGLFKGKSYVKAVDRVSFTINKGETLGLVGESGCGKTTTGRTILKLYNPTAGKIIFKGKDITDYSVKDMVPLRKDMQMIFQDPYASLDPRMTVGDIIGEAIDVHGLYKGEERTNRIRSLLTKVGLASDHINRYPHEFSGGQRQRIGIARALAVQPSLIICDEPISALDVSIQAQVINMLEELQEELGLTYLFIAHDLSMVKHISTHIGVMYLGRMVEKGESNAVYSESMHPYTQALLSAVPIPDPDEAKNNQRIILEGDIPSPIDPPPGCRFQGRCRYAKPICSEIDPELKEVKPGHFVACHLYD